MLKRARQFLRHDGDILLFTEHVAKRKADELKIFDNYVVLHYDPEKKAVKQTKKEEEKEAKAKKLKEQQEGRVKRSVVRGDSADELIKHIQNVDWNKVAEEVRPRTGGKFNFGV